MKAILSTLNDDILAIDGQLPFKAVAGLEEMAKLDMKWFKEHTMYGTVVMGWNTWVSLGEKPLPNRKNIVITSKNFWANENLFGTTLERFLSIDMPMEDTDELWVIGGASIYEQLFPYCDSIYWNKIKMTVDLSDKTTTRVRPPQGFERKTLHLKMDDNKTMLFEKYIRTTK